jgi:hypothetical protein
MPMSRSFQVTKGMDFEEIWDLPQEIELSDIQIAAPFQIKNKKGNVVQELYLNNGYTFFKYNDTGEMKFALSAYETEDFPEGEFYFNHEIKKHSGETVANIKGSMTIVNPEKEGLPPKRPVRPWDFLKNKGVGGEGERSSEEESQKRLSICQECPRFVKATTQCLECGCIMKLKTKLKQASCPIGKW